MEGEKDAVMLAGIIEKSEEQEENIKKGVETMNEIEILEKQEVKKEVQNEEKIDIEKVTKSVEQTYEKLAEAVGASNKIFSLPMRN